jgi:hypothetical protein
MHEINSFKGEDSQTAKIAAMRQLFRSCQSTDELRFLVRSLANTGLRIGLSTKSVEKCLIDYFDSFADKYAA